VHWVHTKFMLVDPLGRDPIVISGSANFSDASTNTNEENMLVIRGDQRVADIYFGEFMRSFAHLPFARLCSFTCRKEETPKSGSRKILQRTQAG
jgi:phosphatidylserine/phosphatidylglycerophosphate/cardiolipin synthase-like enzyme